MSFNLMAIYISLTKHVAYIHVCSHPSILWSTACLYLLKLHLVKSGVERLQDERKESAEQYTLFTAMIYRGLSVTFISNLNFIFNLHCVASQCIHCVI